MEHASFYNQILLEHNRFPENKRELPGANMTLEGVNPSCGDNITLELKITDDVIEDAAFVGSGCAVSQASADIMMGMIIGKRKEEALHLAELFFKMIKGEADEKQMEELEEAGALADIAHMPARVKCAVLGWHTLEELLGKK